jgi:hypothetical protein
MEANPYQSPLELNERTEAKSSAPRFARLRVVMYCVGIVACLVFIVNAMLIIGTLAWLSATPASPGRLAQIQWWFKVWGWILLSLLAAVSLLSFGLWREFQRRV